MLIFHDKLIFSAAAVANGASVSEKIKPAVISPRKGLYGKPSTDAMIAAVARIRMGTYNGNTSSDSNCPPPLRLSVSATPIAPIRLSTGVPSASVAIITGMDSEGRFIHTAKRGDSRTRGKPAISQCVNTLATTITVSECPLI